MDFFCVVQFWHDVFSGFASLPFESVSDHPLEKIHVSGVELSSLFTCERPGLTGVCQSGADKSVVEELSDPHVNLLIA